MDMEHPTATPGPLRDIREGFTPQTSDLRGTLPSPDFMIVSSIDNGQVLNGATNELSAAPFGNC